MPVLSSIAVAPMTYTGGPSFRRENEMYIPNPGPILCVGTPSPEVDEAWEKLTYGKHAEYIAGVS